jgi:hypothetical protein
MHTLESAVRGLVYDKMSPSSSQTESAVSGLVYDKMSPSSSQTARAMIKSLNANAFYYNVT